MVSSVDGHGDAEGVDARYAGGAMGGDRSGVDALSDQVARLAEAGKAAADRL